MGHFILGPRAGPALSSAWVWDGLLHLCTPATGCCIYVHLQWVVTFTYIRNGLLHLHTPTTGCCIYIHPQWVAAFIYICNGLLHLHTCASGCCIYIHLQRVASFMYVHNGLLHLCMSTMGCCIYVHSQSKPDYSQKPDVLITLNASPDFFAARPQPCIPDSRWHTTEHRQCSALLHRWVECG